MEKANLTSSWISLAFICLFAYWGLADQKPSDTYLDSENPDDFSIERAMSHIEVIAKDIHYMGSPYHKELQAYLVEELQALGLNAQVHTNRVFRLSSSSSTGATVENIVAKIKGSGTGKSLLVMAHYDSAAPHSRGASDAGSGVAVILEGLRVFLQKNEQPKNDIIVLFSDAEEAGMMGARAFLENNPLAENVGLALNFEARGSGGPGYMLMETNGKNGKLLGEFIRANPNFPSCNSLVYSIYKIMRNQTDLTPLREMYDIDGLLFAFVDDFFDYHTEQDSPERIDRSSLVHQADYLMSSLNYFAFSNLDDFEGADDRVFANLPFVKLFHYPYSWNLPLFLIALTLVVVLIIMGVKRGKIKLKNSLKSFIPFLLTLVINCLVTFGLWQLILLIHPSYKAILFGFPYNGYYYLAAFMALNCWLSFLIYQKWLSKYSGDDLIIGPIMIWLIFSLAMLIGLPGGSFLILPVFPVIAMMAISMFTEWSNNKKQLVFTVLSLPLLYIFTPFLKFLPVTLGLLAMALATFFLILIFGLLIPIFSLAKHIKYMKYGFAGIAIILLLIATSMRGFNEDRRQPNFIRFFHNADLGVSYWGSLNEQVDPFLHQFFGEKPGKGNLPEELKMGHRLIKTFKKTENRELKFSEIIIHQDSIRAGERFIDFTLSPQRMINMISFIAKADINILKMTVNGTPVSADDYEGLAFEPKEGDNILRYIMTPADKELRITLLTENKDVAFYLQELSYDLLANDLFDIEARANYMMPQISSDAIMSLKTLSF